jgi:hypothetical protein
MDLHPYDTVSHDTIRHDMGSLVALLILLESLQQSGVHICDFIIFKLREQKLLNLKWFLPLETNKN